MLTSILLFCEKYFFDGWFWAIVISDQSYSSFHRKRFVTRIPAQATLWRIGQ